MKTPTFEGTLKRIEAVRNNPAFQLIAPHLKQQGLPCPNDPLAPENAEYALLCLDNEEWNSILRIAISEGNYKQSTGSAFFDEIEQAFEQGADFNELIRKQFNE